MDHRDKLLKLVQEKGPLLPSQINKELNTNVLFASAMLSEMVDTKKLRLTNLKVGGSPLYYYPGQEEKLQEFSHRLNEKDKKTFDLLKAKKVVRDKDQEPLIRVSLREIKDFAIPLQVTVNDNKELFWKFYMLGDDDAEKIIRDYLEKHNYLRPEGESKEKKGSREEKKEEARREAEKEKTRTEGRHKEAERKREAQMTIADMGTRQHKEEIREESREDVATREEDIDDSTKMAEHQIEAQATEIKQDIRVADQTELNYSYSFSFSSKEPEPETKAEEKKEPEVQALPLDDEFFNKIQELFDSGGIIVEDFNLIRKGTEYDFVIRVPSPVGELRYFCKAKSKKKLNDGDVSAAFVAGQMKGLPVIMLTMGEMTARAKEMVEKDFKSFVVKNIE
ncbi:TPA: hypothetical protein HA265_06905 [Candidatus Woesearchaeota archaeon]|nr:hypothetical protein [Candidatus Woesearchaeota archaeon]